jgi:multicomponent Na+:H+ antiporter subunit B
MRYLTIATTVIIFAWLAWLDPGGWTCPGNRVFQIAVKTAIPNTVTGIVLEIRLYDTLFEVFVFTIAVMGVHLAFSRHNIVSGQAFISDPTTAFLSRAGALITGLIALELAIRGHLGPGGGFAAGVAGGTSIGLAAVTRTPETMEEARLKWRLPFLEKSCVLLILVVSSAVLFGIQLPRGQFGSLASGGAIPLLNMLTGLKVTVGSWTVLLLFVRYRGLF